VSIGRQSVAASLDALRDAVVADGDRAMRFSELLLAAPHDQAAQIGARATLGIALASCSAYLAALAAERAAFEGIAESLGEAPSWIL